MSCQLRNCCVHYSVYIATRTCCSKVAATVKLIAVHIQGIVCAIRLIQLQWEQPVQGAVVEVICLGTMQGILWFHIISAGFARLYNSSPCCMASGIATESMLSAEAQDSLKQKHTLILLILLLAFCREGNPAMATPWKPGGGERDASLADLSLAS